MQQTVRRGPIHTSRDMIPFVKFLRILWCNKLPGKVYLGEQVDDSICNRFCAFYSATRCTEEGATDTRTERIPSIMFFFLHFIVQQTLGRVSVLRAVRANRLSYLTFSWVIESFGYYIFFTFLNSRIFIFGCNSCLYWLPIVISVVYKYCKHFPKLQMCM